VRCDHNDCPNEATHKVWIEFRSMYEDEGGEGNKRFQCRDCISRANITRSPLTSRSRRYIVCQIASHFWFGFRGHIAATLLIILAAVALVTGG